MGAYMPKKSPNARQCRITASEERVARKSAETMLRSKFPRLASRHEDFVQSAFEYALKRWDPSETSLSLAAVVRNKAELEAINYANRDEKKLAAPVARSRAERPQTRARLLAAIREECESELTKKTGSAWREWLKTALTDARYVTPKVVEEWRVCSRAAKKILAALEECGHHPWIVEGVSVDTMKHYAQINPNWRTTAGRLIGFSYGRDSFYGDSSHESAVLSVVLAAAENCLEEILPKIVDESDVDGVAHRDDEEDDDATALVVGRVTARDVIGKLAEGIRKAAKNREVERAIENQRAEKRHSEN